jgi:regulator of sigma E protease
VVNGVTNGSPAAIAGLQAGDSIVGINEQGNMSMEEIAASLLYNKEKPITLEVYRRGEPSCDLTLTPNEFGKIGVLLRPIQDIYTPVIKHYNFFTAFPAGIRMGWEIITSYVGQLKYVFSKEGAQSLGGFGAIGNLFPDQWNWFGFWNLTALLSIMLGVMNILPIPALDGGHILFLLVEVVSGRKPSDKFLERAQMVGMVLLISLLIYANGMDIFRAFFK